MTRVFGTKTSTVMYTPFTFILNTPMQSYMCGGPPINPSSLENDSFMMNPHSPPAVPAAESRVTFGFHWIFSFSTPKMAPLCTAKLSKNRPTRVLPACAIFFSNGLLVSAQKIRLRAA